MGICQSKSQKTLSLYEIVLMINSINKTIKTVKDKEYYNIILNTTPIMVNFFITNNVLQMRDKMYNAHNGRFENGVLASIRKYINAEIIPGDAKICISMEVYNNLVMLYKNKRCIQCDEIFCNGRHLTEVENNGEPPKYMV